MDIIRRGQAQTLDTPTPQPEPEVVNTGGRYEPTKGVTPRGSTGYSRQVPWGLGRAIGSTRNTAQFATTREAMRDAGLDWEVTKGNLFSAHDDEIVGLDGWQTVQRADTGKVLGIVKGRYEPIQNRRLAEFNDVLVDASQGERAAVGSAFDDRRVYCVTQLDDIDSSDGGLGVFLVTTNSHDGGTSLSSSVVNVRWACTNGLVALSDKAHTVKIRHTIKAEERLVEAQRILAGVSDYLVDTTRIMEQLLATPVSVNMAGDWIRNDLAPVPDTDHKTAIRNAERKQDELLATLRWGDNLEGIRDTGWGFLNAVAEWNEWTGSGVRRRTRTPMERLIAGSGQDIVHQARDLVMAV